MNIKALATLILCMTYSHISQAYETIISQRDGSLSSLTINSGKISLVTNNTSSMELDIESEKELHLEISDYNFDGFIDFSVWHMDDGMGTYMEYRVFIYNRSRKSFEEAHPACGDEFINLKTDTKKKRLTSTWFTENTPNICHTKL